MFVPKVSSFNYPRRNLAKGIELESTLMPREKAVICDDVGDAWQVDPQDFDLVAGMQLSTIATASDGRTWLIFHPYK